LELDLECAERKVVLGSLFVINITPDIKAINCEVESCGDGAVHPALGVIPNNVNAGDGCYTECIGLSPYWLMPPDGADGVALNTALSWTAPTLFTSDHCVILIGTDPDCSDAQQIEVDCAMQIVYPHLLQPSTTYYWRVVFSSIVSQCYRQGGSAVHSFTTTGPLAVEKSTWGGVKAMYRE